MDALPLPRSFVVNIGELLELAANGYLRATVHRVVSPPPDEERLPIAFFRDAQLDAVVPVYALPPVLARETPGPLANLLVDPYSRLRRALLPDRQAEQAFLQRHSVEGRLLCEVA